MEQNEKKYREDYEALVEKISYYPAISIVSTEKDPPEQYVIEYKLFGYGYTDDGGIQMARRHQVKLFLPFGYPHFAPTAKPLTRICHPDVSEQAIRIADQWQSNQSLADLVVYIGEMICGKVYSTEGAFNEEAATWYQENQDKLPLAELEYQDPNRIEPSESGSGLPIKSIVTVLLLAVLVIGGGLFYREFHIVKAAEEQLQQVYDGLGRRQFKQASLIATAAVESLSDIYILQNAKDAMQMKFTTVLESDALREGLLGRVKYQDEFIPIPVADARHKIEQVTDAAIAQLSEGEVEVAKGLFGAAIKLADQNGLTAIRVEIQQVAARERLEYHVERANTLFSQQKWEDAGKEYDLAVSILENEQRYIDPDTRASQGKLEKLEIISQINVLKNEALALEEQEQFDSAARSYKAIVTLIKGSDYGDDKVLAQIAADAHKEGVRLAEELMIAAGNAYLIEHYKDIFTRHYPGLRRSALQSPQVRFFKRDTGKMVFLMSCIELIQMQSNEFRLMYQYDPARRSWNIYQEKR